MSSCGMLFGEVVLNNRTLRVGLSNIFILHVLTLHIHLKFRWTFDIPYIIIIIIFQSSFICTDLLLVTFFYTSFFSSYFDKKFTLKQILYYQGSKNTAIHILQIKWTVGSVAMVDISFWFLINNCDVILYCKQ